MPSLAFQQVDVFSDQPFRGNPVAVVLGADGLDDATMAAIASWTNLSETTFVLAPTDPSADYRLRIFTPAAELPFAGHPTLGSCHAWLAAGGRPRGATVFQQCGVGLVPLRRDGGRLAFAAPPLRRAGPVAPELRARIAACLGLAPNRLRDAQWIDNGPGWVAALLASRAEALALRPDFAAMGDLMLGVVAPWDPAADGTEADFEVRGFAPAAGVAEDPVTGSLNAGLARWLLASGRATGPYVASQGAALGRAGRIHVDPADGEIWVGGATVTRIAGRLTV